PNAVHPARIPPRPRPTSTLFPYTTLFRSWHALTTHYDDPSIIETSTWEMLIDWLAAGIDPSKAGLFIQSQVPEHAELHLLLSMVDRKSTRLNSSHVKISYAVFCLKKKSLP